MRARTRRTTERVALSLLLSSLLATLSAGLQGPVLRPDVVRAEARVEWTLEGTVLEPDGRPAAGAVVVTSAGGKAVVAPDGSYRLALPVPRDAERVQVTAVGRGGARRTASTSVDLTGPGPLWTGPLVLALGSTCLTGWMPTFGPMPGASEPVHALAVFDDGSGPALYVGGEFENVGGVAVDFLARWDGEAWSEVGGGTSAPVRSMVVHDDGSGAALYVGGDFNQAGGLPARRVARWDGEQWTALGEGLSGGGSPSVTSLVSCDHGAGPVLYAGGRFLDSGPIDVRRIARWDGTAWSGIGAGDAAFVYALAAHDDGSGERLYAAGTFTVIGGVAAANVASFDGSAWSPLGTGTNTSVFALTSFDDGGGPRLYAAGGFDTAGGVPASRVAAWDGSTWTALGGGLGGGPGFGPGGGPGLGSVLALTSFDDGGGPLLHAAGSFTEADGAPVGRIARWDGSAWSPLGEGLDGDVSIVGAGVLATFELDGVERLYAGGAFTLAGTTGAGRIAEWDGSQWSALGGLAGAGGVVYALEVLDLGDGPALHAGGEFTSAGGEILRHVGRWNGSGWESLGEGLGQVSTVKKTVGDLACYDDGGGEALYAAGRFGEAGGAPAMNIARWDGTSWTPLGSGITGVNPGVEALEVYDAGLGAGPELVVCGSFDTAGGLPAANIARWNGSSWAPLGSGLSSFGMAMVVHDSGLGGGPELVVGGNFSTAGGVSTGRIARWDGSSWSSLGSGITSSIVLGLAVWDSGGGPELYAGGVFSQAGGVQVNHVARWNGSSWSALGSGVSNAVNALEVHDDGAGAALYAGGLFETAGGMAANRIARWDGLAWSALGAGTGPQLYALRSFDDGGGPSLFAGGSFFHVPESGDSFLARWGCDDVPPVLECPTTVTAYERPGSVPGEVVTFTVTATDNLDPAPLVQCVPPSGSVFPFGTTLVTCTAIDSEGNQAQCQFPVVVRPKAAEFGF